MARPKTIRKRELDLLEALRAADGSELQKEIVWRAGFHVADLKEPVKTLRKKIKEGLFNTERRSLWLESRTTQAPYGYRIIGGDAEPTTPDLIRFDSISEPHFVFYEELMKQGWVWDESNKKLTKPKN
ncbi:hypothetical protein I6L41_06170 [Aeromonas sp. FDAARGOS 1411]|uniref:hypothetical protein n=1 Tax=Aeromonas TaxID=642 RepID=UPI001C22DBAC|nr:hypothetical protein [Aeromonas sp. FDAARGOS 1411]QWZ95844.1 hypothetical protein I6L41_06050 [Aeromonas sp. FDAARGOS 1411]QWZ95856.1 hypothetical protein I6L41_06110 [Aeromonas sp. FDAARGOS 1411]QWZ95868.1 hypothetical protein I6L41_06170 [Aeromonas sp. FDAARGOS 1411]